MNSLKICSPCLSSIFDTFFVDQESQSPVGCISIDGLTIVPSTSKWKGPPPFEFPEAYRKLKSYRPAVSTSIEYSSHSPVLFHPTVAPSLVTDAASTYSLVLKSPSLIWDMSK